jgi:hypothetical protein
VTDYVDQRDCPVHLQNGPKLCGPAAAMMPLAYLGFSYRSLDQDRLYGQILDHNITRPSDGWWSDPCGLRGVLNDFMPERWAIYLRNNQLVATMDLLYSLWIYNQPPLFHARRGHWMVLSGAVASGDPRAGDFHVKTLWVNDPLSDCFPYGHYGGDVCSRLRAPDGVSWSEWKENFILAEGDALWSHQELTVGICKSDLEIEFGRLVEAAGGEAEPSRGIAESADAWFQQEIGIHPAVRDYVKGASRQGELLVKDTSERNLPKEDSYYLIPFVKRGAVVGSMKLDSHGNFRSFRAHFGEIDSSILSTEAQYFWQPSKESISPHLPFLRSEENYVRLDGRMFPKLTRRKKG